MRKYVLSMVVTIVILGIAVYVAQSQLWAHYKPYDETVRLETPFLSTIKEKYPEVNPTFKNEDFIATGRNIHVATSPILFLGVFDHKESVRVFVGNSIFLYSYNIRAPVVYVAPLAADTTSLVVYTEFLQAPTNSKNWKLKDASLDRLVWRYDNKNDVRLAVFVGCYFVGVIAWIIAMIVLHWLYEYKQKRRQRPKSG